LVKFVAMLRRWWHLIEEAVEQARTCFACEPMHALVLSVDADGLNMEHVGDPCASACKDPMVGNRPWHPQSLYLCL